MNKEEYIEYAKKTFQGETLNLVLHQIELFYADKNVENKKKYHVGDNVVLSKGTFLHGIPGGIENFDWIIEHGFISNDFTGKTEMKNKIKNSIGMWKIQEDCLLKDYIIKYSGFTITYSIGRGPGPMRKYDLVPYHKFDEYTEKINNDENIWSYSGEQTKEVRFIPSLISNKRQIAFILNMESDYAKKLAEADVWNLKLNAESLTEFLDERYYEKFLEERFHRTALTTDRESAIIFGLPSKLIEGVFVGRKIERDQSTLEYIKQQLPDVYICNLDGKVIVE